jgi:hypothetical protein
MAYVLPQKIHGALLAFELKYLILFDLLPLHGYLIVTQGSDFPN